MNAAFGPYVVVGELGRGGMGVVYKAYETSLRRHVAIKALAPGLVPPPGMAERFLREAQAMAAVSDPHVLPIYRVEQDDAGPWFAMEWIEGENLAQVVARLGRVPEAQALELVRQAARGLAAAHARGLVHRDIKPANLLLGANGVLKVADFGIARAQAESAPRLTGTGDVVGTPGYLSPEACLGQPIDGRTDLFALGIVLYELLSGRLPFEADSPFHTLQRVVQEPPRALADLDVAVHPATATLLDRLLAKSPAARFDGAEALLAALAEHPLLATPPPALRATPAPVLAPTVPSPRPAGLRSGTPSAPPSGEPPSGGQATARPGSAWVRLAPGAAIAVIAGLALVWWRTPSAPPAEPAPTEAAAQSPPPPVATTAEPAAEPTAEPAAEPTAEPAVEPVAQPAPEPARPAPAAREPAPARALEPAPPAEDPGPVARYGEVWTGPGVVEVAIADIPGADAAYVRITGINHPWDGQVLRLGHRPAPRDGRDYALPLAGSDWVMVVKRRDFRSGRMQAWLYVPGLGDVGELTEAPDAARALDTAALRDAWPGRNPERAPAD